MRPDTVLFVVCLLAAVLCGASGAAAVDAKTEGDLITIGHGELVVRYDRASGLFAAQRGARAFLAEGRLIDSRTVQDATTKVVEARGPLGTGRAIEVTWPDGQIRRLALYDSLPWICLTGSVRNVGKTALAIDEVAALSARADVGVPSHDLRGFGPEGPHDIGKRTNFCFAAAVDPRTRTGVVCGWLSHFRGSGVVTLAAKDRGVAFEGRCQYGRLQVPPAGVVEGETLAIGCFDDALDGLELYADACAKMHRIRLREKVPCGYCTWYHAGASDQNRTAQLAAFAGKQLKTFGFDFIQIDDGWQIASRDFSAHNPRGPYSKGMKPTAQKIAAAGLTPGLWLIPFGWDPRAPVLSDHADWFVKRPDGAVYSVTWAGSCLDMTHPEARQFLRQVVDRMARQWRYRYLKIDGLWSGMAVKILYPSPACRPDELGQARLHDPSKTQIEAYRSGLQLVREAAGSDVFLLGCNIAQNARTLGASFGLVDGMRIGHDIAANWGAIRGCAVPASHLYFFHRRVWFNDPDCLIVRSPLTLDQARAWASLVALSGQMNVVSEWLPGLPADRLDIVKRTMPNHNAAGRPIDLFDRSLPRVWHLRGKLAGQPVDLVGVWNWDEKRSARVEVELAPLGLPASPQDRYVGFDFWEKSFVSPLSSRIKLDLRPSSCRMIALHRLADRPQLVSTSRHVTQGMIDVASLTWDAGKQVLAGRSRLVAGDPYELRIAAPAGWKVTAADVSEADRKAGVVASMKQSSGQIRVLLDSPQGREVDWRLECGK